MNLIKMLTDGFSTADAWVYVSRRKCARVLVCECVGAVQRRLCVCVFVHVQLCV